MQIFGRLLLGCALVLCGAGFATAAGLRDSLQLSFDSPRPVFDRKTRELVQRGTLSNVSAAAIAAPISLVLTGQAPENTSLVLAEVHGEMADGSPFVELLKDGAIQPGESVPIAVRFKLESGASRLAASALEILGDTLFKPFVPEAAVSFTHTLVRVPAGNHPPAAQAGGDWTTGLDVPVTLDGAGSSDTDGQLLSYRWTLTQTPSGSQAQLSAPRDAQTTLIPDLAGTYTATLVVNDGFVDGTPDTVSIVASSGGGMGQNRSPVVTSTPSTGGTGTKPYKYQVLASDADGDMLTFSLSKKPAGMTIDPATGVIEWIPPQPHHDGMKYVVEVTVSDGKGGEAIQNFFISVKICTCV